MALNALQSFVASLDTTGALHDISYALSYNKQLGYNSNDPSSAFQFIPYGVWQAYDNQTNPLPSVLEQAFRDTIVVGHTVDGDGVTPDTKNSFIDVLQLAQPDPLFFNEILQVGPDAGKSLIEVIARTVNGMDPTATPVIRFLVGNPFPPGQVCPSEYTDVFWPGGQPIITHPNAVLYVGTFNPAINIQQDLQADIVTWLDAIVNAPEAQAIQWVDSLGLPWPLQGWAEDLVYDFFNTTDKGLNSTLGWLIDNIFPGLVTPLSWNHAKIVAVNGRSLLTGGGNYYDLYTTQGGGSLIDNDITILGDAARTAHNYSDFLWKYLNSDHKASDPSSVIWSTKLNVASPGVKGIPLGGQAPLFPAADIPPITGSVPVLTMGKSGNFFPPLTNVSYPAQVLDAVRDLFWQVAWEKGQIPLSELDPNLENYNLLPLIAQYTNDSYLLGDLTDLGVSPASWASRIARTQAVAGATDYVYISQQMLVNWDMSANATWMKAVAQINTDLDINWDGKFWPYDLLMAIANAIATIETTHPSDPNAGVYVVLSMNDPSTGQGYEDRTPLSDLTTRLTYIVGNMSTFGLLPDLKPDVVSRRFFTKRSDLLPIGPKDPFIQKKLHTKVVDVDGKLLYIGSDNAYPQWNEQFGVWIEDAKSIQAWEDVFFDGLWQRALGWD